MMILALATLVYSILTAFHSVKAISFVTIFGLVLDTLNQHFSLLVFPTPWLPVWLIGLWVLFAWYAYQLKVLLHRFVKIYVSVLGGLGGMLTYFAGYKLQAVEFGFDTSITLLALFVEWLVLMLVILKVYNNGKLKEKTRKGYG